jgi:hypothetical protein
MSREAARTEAKPGCFSSAGFAGSHGFHCVSVRDMPLIMPNMGILLSICTQGRHQAAVWRSASAYTNCKV